MVCVPGLIICFDKNAEFRAAQLHIIAVFHRPFKGGIRRKISDDSGDFFDAGRELKLRCELSYNSRAMAQTIPMRKKTEGASLVRGQIGGVSRARQTSDEEANRKKAWAMHLKVCRENESVLRALAKM